MHWLALLRAPHAPPWPEALVWWALRFTPRVARLEDGLLLELAASLRLFGGQAALQQRLLTQWGELGELTQGVAPALAWAPNSLAALALARAGAPGKALDGCRSPLPALLDGLPFSVLRATQAHAPLLARLGCRTLADLRRLPRAALARRTAPRLLHQLDLAYGETQAEAHDWCVAPERFEARCELPQRTDAAALLLQHAEPLLQAACLWLAARQAGSAHIAFGWQHDAMRARDIGPGGELVLAASEPHRELRIWLRLLGEHLHRLPLQAPVSDLWLRIDHAEPLALHSDSLLPTQGAAAGGETLNQLLTRLSVRLGAEQVRQAVSVADHRPECQQQWLPWQQWQPLAGRPAPRDAPLPDAPAQWPQPSWLLDPPLPLSVLNGQPCYQGPLTLLAGPQRMETGWWDQAAVRRDYFLAHSRRAGLLWVFREHHGAGWFLHGVFA